MISLSLSELKLTNVQCSLYFYKATLDCLLRDHCIVVKLICRHNFKSSIIDSIMHHNYIKHMHHTGALLILKRLSTIPVHM